MKIESALLAVTMAASVAAADAPPRAESAGRIKADVARLTKPGARVTIVVRRGDKDVPLDVVPGSRPSATR